MIISNRPTCTHNNEVICELKEKPCATCGWNPEVAKARLERITNAHQERKNTKK